LVVAVEVPSLQLQLAEPSYRELISAAQFGDGAAAAMVSRDEAGPEVVGTRSVLLPETEEGGSVIACETGFRLVPSGGLPGLIRARVRALVSGCADAHHIDADRLSFVVAHPRGREVLQAVADGLSVERPMLAASWETWETCGNMVSASIYRALTYLSGDHAPSPGDPGIVLAFGTGVACELLLVRWRSAPHIASA
jgi:alkylresorcinol/alkylpyrone synthase